MKQNGPNELDRDFVDIVRRIVKKLLPHGTEDEKRKMQADLAALSRNIMLQAIRHMKDFDE